MEKTCENCLNYKTDDQREPCKYCAGQSKWQPVSIGGKVDIFRKGFTDIFDNHGKFKKHYVENVEGVVIKQEDEIQALRAEIIRLKTKPCDTCDKQNDGQFTGKCHICSSFYDNQYEAKR